MAGERRARAARRGQPRGREPPGRAGGSNKTNAITCPLSYPLWNEFSCVEIPAGEFAISDLRPIGFAPSAANRLGPALNCPAGSQPSARRPGATAAWQPSPRRNRRQDRALAAAGRLIINPQSPPPRPGLNPTLPPVDPPPASPLSGARSQYPNFTAGRVPYGTIERRDGQSRTRRLERAGPLAAGTGPWPARTCHPRPAGRWQPPPASDSDERPPPHHQPAQSETDPGQCLRLRGLQ